MRAGLAAAYKGRRALVTGHTGFKGAWLAFWLHELGAEVSAFGLPPETRPSLHRELRLDSLVRGRFIDLADARAVRAFVRRARPEFVFHLAAQSLVRRSYREPARTLETNVLGTWTLLEAARDAGARAIVVATSDKCYDRPESGRAFREDDPLGGHDPYSASKACQELVAASFRDSFLRGCRTALATARAGNVIGGGDRSEDRLLPDCVRAFEAGRPAVLRSPRSIRPWQHCLDPLHGYLALAAALFRDPARYSGAWNFGPDPRAGDLTVKQVADLAAERWGGRARVVVRQPAGAPPEAPTLRLDPSKARRRLNWRPAWTAREAVALTVDWHRARNAGADARDLLRAQLELHARAFNH